MIKIKKSEFSELYNKACPNWKIKFNDKFKNSLFSEELEFEEGFLTEMELACDADQLKIFQKIFKKYIKEDLLSKIKTYSDVCKELGEKEEKSPYNKLKQIERLFGRNWKKDWSNKSQYKHYPYFSITASGGLVFYDTYFHCVDFGDEVAFFPDSKTAEFVGKTFIKIYEELMNS